MKKIMQRFAATVAICAITATSVIAAEAADATENQFEKAEAYWNRCVTASSADFAKIRAKIKEFIDVELMAETMNAPEKYTKWGTSVSNPTF